MRRGPSIALLLLGANLFVLLLPIASLLLWRAYDLYLLRQTERQLINQSVVVAEAFRPAGSSCTVGDNGDDTYTIWCDDGSQATVSNGRDGDDATPGVVLLRIVAEPKGAHCHNGGNLIEVGVDADQSGVLDPTEVSSAEYACAPLATIQGNISILDDDDVEQLRGVAAIIGTLTIGGSFSDVAALHEVGTDLTSVTNLYISGTSALTSFDADEIFDELTSLDFLLVQENTALTSVSFNQLTQARGLDVLRNGLLASASFNQLATVAQRVTFSTNAKLASISLAQLTSAGTLGIDNNPLLTSIPFGDQLTSIGHLGIGSNASLSSFSFDGLTSLNNLAFNSNPALTSISFDQLRTVSNVIQILNNTALPQCRIQGIVNQLTTAPTYISMSGNASSCPP